MIARIQKFIRSDIEIVPPELRAEFRKEMSHINIRRMSLIAGVLAFANIIFLITIDVLNLLHLPVKARIIAFVLHASMLGVALGILWLSTRFRGLNVDEMEPFHYQLGLLLPTGLLVFPTILLYQIALNNSNPTGPYCAVIILWGAGLMAEFRFAVRVILANNAIFYASMVYLGSQMPINYGIESFLSTELTTIGVLLGMSLSFRKNAESFVQRKHLELERNRIADLNDEIAAAYEEAEALNNTLTNTLRTLEHEQETSERLLLNVLPQSIAERMKSGETTIAEHFTSVTVLFADIVGFTKLSSSMSPAELVELLDRLFTAFDALANKHGIEKIKTIGDAYMAVCGVPEASAQHVERVLSFAHDIQHVMAQFREQEDFDIQVRIGVHTGEVVAGIIGKKKFSYDLWGDTVNIASRMESHGEAGKIHISPEVYDALRNHQSFGNGRVSGDISHLSITSGFIFEERGEIEIKGKGKMPTWFVTLS